MSVVRTSAGHVLSVQSRELGSALDGDQAAGATVLTVQDCSDFDDMGAGGQITLNDVTYIYSDVNDDASTLVISPALTADASDGDQATILDPIFGLAQYTTTASVTEDGEDPGEPIEADVASALVDQLPEGVRGASGEAVTLTWDENDDPTVTAIGGLNTGQNGFYQDETTVLGPGGVVTLDLKYIPVENSEHLYVGGVYQRGAVWTRDRWTVTIPDEEARLRAGIKVAMEYAYTDPAQKPPVVYGGVAGHLRAATWGSYPSAFITSQALNAGTAVGDLLVVVAMGDGDCTIGDTRLTVIADSGHRKVAVGYATDLSAVDCHVGGSGFPLDQFAGIEVLSVQGDGSGPLVYDPARIAIYDVVSGGAIGSVSGSGHGVVAALAAGYANPIVVDMATDMPAYADWGGSTGTAVGGNFGYCATEPPPAQTNPVNTFTLLALIGLK